MGSKKKGKVFIPLLLPPKEKILEVLNPVAEIKLGHGKVFTEDELCEEIKDVDGILASMQDCITERVIKSGKKLKIISKYGTGVDNIDIKAATKMGVLVTNSPLNAISVAEHVIFLIIACLRKVPQLIDHMKSGNWGLTIPDELLGNEIYQCTLGIIGLGNIGSIVANRAKCFGANILAYDPYIEKEKASLIAKLVDLDTLLKESDIISLHVPLTDATKYMISEREFKLMKPSAILINTSRGAIVDEQNLIKALENKWITGACLDVLEKVPPPTDSPFFDLKNLILTPHIGGSTIKARERVVTQTARSVVQVLLGKLPPFEFIVNKELVIGNESFRLHK